MAVSSSSNDSFPLPQRSFIESYILSCTMTAPSSVLYLAYHTANTILLLPLCTFILYLGVRRWRQRRSASSAAAATSHSDAFTYHLAAMELVGVSGSVLCCCGIANCYAAVVLPGYALYAFAWYSETTFHVLTCVERYLAVVHPITYRNLRSRRGIRIRNVALGCVWLLSVVETSVMMLTTFAVIFDFCFLISFFVVVSFCSLSVLCALIRPGPGHHGGDRDRVDQSKQKAFYTILAILGVLLLRFGWNLVWLSLFMTKHADCLMISWNIWFNLPCSLVLPLLFLCRTGIKACCKKNEG